MDVYKGTGAFSGIAIGKILYYHKSEYQMRQYEIADVKAELNIFRQARTRVMEQLEDRLNYAKEIGGSYGGIIINWIIGHTNRYKAAISDR